LSQPEPIKFPGQEFGKSLGKIQDLLYTSNHLAEELVPDVYFQKTFSGCIKAVQGLLCEVNSSIEEVQRRIEEAAMEELRRQKLLWQQMNDTITDQEEEPPDTEPEE
jgi:hypothetical protein